MLKGRHLGRMALIAGATALILSMGSVAIRSTETIGTESLGSILAYQQSDVDAQKAYVNTLTTLRDLQATAKTSVCLIDKSVKLECFENEHERRVVLSAPFPAAFSMNGERVYGIEGDFTEYFADTSWAPTDSVAQGGILLDKLESSVKSGKPVGCDEDDCYIAIREQSPDARLIGICESTRVGTQLGPAKNCMVAAIERNSKWTMKILAGGKALESPKMAPILTYDIKGLPKTSILSALDMAFAKEPLSMSQRSVKVDRIMVLGPKRFSYVLSGRWFEWPQVLVEIDDSYKIDVSLDLLVNKQNTADPADWHLPTDQQTEEYTQAVQASIKQALASVCVGPIWTGSTNLQCAQFKTANGELVSIPDMPPSTRIQPQDTRITVKKGR